MGLQHLPHFLGRLQAHLLCPMPALQPCDPCGGGKKTVGPRGGQGSVQARECGWRGVSGPPHPWSPETVLRGSGRGWGCWAPSGWQDWLWDVLSGPEGALTCAGPILPGQVKLPQQLHLRFIHAQGLGLFPCNDMLFLRPAQACALPGWSPAPRLTADPLFPSPHRPFASAVHCQVWCRK